MADGHGDPAAAIPFNVESFVLLGIGICVVALRTYARITKVGLGGLQADDYIIWISALAFSVMTGLAFSVGAVSKDLANSGMTDEQRAALDPESEEYRLRVIGSKIHMAGWSSSYLVLWSLKLCMCFLYLRIIAGQNKYRRRVFGGIVLVFATWAVAQFNLLLGCQPLHRYWQINPDPGDECQPAISRPMILVYLICNVVSDCYIIWIPIPMLLATSLKPSKKAAIIGLFTCGLFIVVAAILRGVIILTSPSREGARLAGAWAVREAFVATVTTNLPMISPIILCWARPISASIKSHFRSKSTSPHLSVKLRAIETIGQICQRRNLVSANHIPDNTTTWASESQERMVPVEGLRVVGACNVSDAQDRERWKEDGGKDPQAK